MTPNLLADITKKLMGPPRVMMDLAQIKEHVDDMMDAGAWLAEVSGNRHTGLQAQLVAEEHYKKAKKAVKSGACDDIPALVTEIERLREEKGKLRDICTRMEAHLRDVLPDEEVDRLLEGEG